MKFKIDLSRSSYAPFGVFVERKGMFKSEWHELDRFDDREKARAYYERIKDLPEYLD